MNKLIIVDDEEFAREQIAEMIDWNSLGFELSGSFSDGKEALDFLAQNRIDVILADIKMPCVSGIELAEKVYTLSPHTLVVLISGYKDFEFARKAMQYNVTNYILKPITYSEVYKTVSKLRDILVNRHKIATFSDNELSLSRQQIFSNLLSGTINSLAELRSLLTDAHIYIEPDNCECAVINMHLNNLAEYLTKTWKYGKDRLYSALDQLITSETPDFYLVPSHYSFDNLQIITLCKKPSENQKKRLNNFCSELKANAMSVLNLSCEINILQISDNLFNLNKFQSQDLLVSQLARTLLSYIHAGNIEVALSCAHTTIENFSGVHSTLELLSKYLMAGLIDMLGIDGLTLCGFNESDINKLKDPSSVSEYILKLISNSVYYFANNHSPQYGNLIDRAMNYIKEHYKEDITLEDVAQYVALSPVYFSNYFKKQTNEKFIDYLTRVRIEKAQEFLKNSDYKVYEVFEMVGYKSRQHFYKLFKLYTGFTPIEYRNNILRGMK